MALSLQTALSRSPRHVLPAVHRGGYPRRRWGRHAHLDVPRARVTLHLRGVRQGRPPPRHLRPIPIRPPPLLHGHGAAPPRHAPHPLLRRGIRDVLWHRRDADGPWGVVLEDLSAVRAAFGDPAMSGGGCTAAPTVWEGMGEVPAADPLRYVALPVLVLHPNDSYIFPFCLSYHTFILVGIERHAALSYTSKIQEQAVSASNRHLGKVDPLPPVNPHAQVLLQEHGTHVENPVVKAGDVKARCELDVESEEDARECEPHLVVREDPADAVVGTCEAC